VALFASSDSVCRCLWRLMITKLGR
jgi:hypothetical protein